MSYEFDVFLSYRRLNQWPRWVDVQFLPVFRHWLGEELGRDPEIFIDRKNIESGDSWPHHLAQAHSRSRVLVCLWTRPYFQSTWCQTELARMLDRRKPTAERYQGLVHAAFLYDGDTFPDAVKHVQSLDLTQCVSVQMAPGSPKAEEMESLIKGWVPGIAHSILTAPEYDASWLEASAEAFLGLLNPKPIAPALPRLG